ncbi:hypothetical protein JAAARDRAFT_306398 [Jaapia argillacea MUCL 33604]|uniref:NAD(P)-binding protein n=1 Tax=Jaapia argillacea MUCL 33604 TaxID=933084 RepID=A0A067PY96_9AGAM|nr:hypothetical protein JAAARDRAFT_306398 [Jaapia argillacea MUCL 33604]
MDSSIKPSLGRTAFITGGAQGIGRAIAIRLANDGYDISIAEIPSAKERLDATIKEIEGLGRKAIGTFADVRKPEQIYAAIEETVQKLGPTLYISIANAGVAQVKPLLECTPEFIENEVSINFLGLMNTHIAAAKQMVKQGLGGRIIGAGSIASFRTGECLGPYCATKFAVRGFTEAAAKEWARYGIRVNAYAPGFVDTPMWDHIDAELAKIVLQFYSWMVSPT